MIAGPNLSEVEPQLEVKNEKEEIERQQPEPPEEREVELQPPPTPVQVEAEMAAGKSVKKVKQAAGGGALVEGKRVVKGSVNLLKIFTELDDYFLKASESAHEVSKMLEATRLHYHSNFADNRGKD